jgi:hypothetical protein
MKTDELFESDGRGKSTEVTVLQNLLKKGPLFYATVRGGGLSFHQIYSIKSEGQVYSDAAPADLRGRPYATVLFKAPGYNDINGKSGIGEGHGDGSFTIADDGSAIVYVKLVKVFRDQPKFFVVYTLRWIEKDIEQHEQRMKDSEL